MKRIEKWYRDDIRTFCIRHNYYTHGNNAHYESMLTYVYLNQPTTEALEWVANDILKHSDDPENTVTNVMYQLYKEVVNVFFEEEEEN